MRIRKVVLLPLALALLVVNAPWTPAAATSEAVTPIRWSSFSHSLPRDANALRMAAILNNANKYALTTWYSRVKGFDSPRQRDSYYLDLGGRGEHSIRSVANEALSLAVSLRTGVYRSAVTGVVAGEAERRTAKLVRSLARSHLANSPGGWGHGWQSALWAALAGQAGWLMWESTSLSANDRTRIRRMVASEANRFIGYRVPYYKNSTGAIVSRGDSKAEENSWNAMVLQVATAMMPRSAKQHAWMHKAQVLMVSAFAQPADVQSTVEVGGNTVANWLYGSNANPDGTVVNHHRIHPDYMVTVSQAAFAALNYSLARRATPAAAFFNTQKVYAALSTRAFVPGEKLASGGRAAEPGGPIYRPGSADLYYPERNDWGTDRQMPFALADAQASAFGYDALASVSGGHWEALHAQRVLDMQQLHPDRRTYATRKQDTYVGREEYVAVCAGQAYLSKWLVHQGAFSLGTGAVPLVVNALDRGFSINNGRWTTTAPADKLGHVVRSSHPRQGASSARFTPRIGAAGSYKVYAWWSAKSSNASNAAFIIRSKTGSHRVIKNQRSGGGQWQLLGRFTFSAGTLGHVELSNQANGSVVADSIMLLR